MLAGLELFASSTPEQLAELVGRAEIRAVPAGTVLSAQDGIDEAFWVLLDGEVELRRDEERNPPFVQRSDYVGSWMGAGVLSARPSTVGVTATRSSTVLRIGADQFRELLGQGFSIARHMLIGVSEGTQLFEGMLADQERLAALGKLSAGLAHELNNPVAAVTRTASRLADRSRAVHRALFVAHGGDPTTFDTVLAGRGHDDALTPLQRSAAEDDMTDLLEAAGVVDAEDCATAFVDAGVPADVIADLVADDPRPVGRVADALEAIGMVDQLADAAGRIAELVDSIRAYTHMDRANLDEIDVHDGINRTLTMLGYQLKTLHVVRDYGAVPPVTAQPGQLNQVWTNLIDNAAAAITSGDGDGDRERDRHAGGTITIRTRADGDDAVVAIHDTGPGVPDELQRRVFEPFFTTKGVGAGTGLGLDVVRRIVEVGHGGTLTLRSSPGDTTFEVRLPLRQAPESTAAAPERVATSQDTRP